MMSILGSLSFAKLVMMSSAPAISVARGVGGLPDTCPIQSKLQSVLGVRSFYVKRNK